MKIPQSKEARSENDAAKDTSSIETSELEFLTTEAEKRKATQRSKPWYPCQDPWQVPC